MDIPAPVFSDSLLCETVKQGFSITQSTTMCQMEHKYFLLFSFLFCFCFLFSFILFCFVLFCFVLFCFSGSEVPQVALEPAAS